MTLSQLEYAIAVAKYRNFRKAAKSCFVSQPTLSAQIQKLEEHLGVLLFDRGQSPIEVTPLGQIVLKQSEVVMNEYQKIAQIVKEEKNTIQGSLKIGIIPTIAPYLVPLFLSSFHKKYPNINLSILELTTPNCLAQLNSNDIDIAVLATRESRQTYSQIHLYSEELFLYFNKKDISDIDQITKANELLPNKTWLLEPGHCLRDEIVKLAKLDTTEQPSIDLKVGSLEMLTRLVDTNGGYTVIPQLMLMGLHNKSKVKAFTNKPKRKINLTFKKNHWKLSLIQLLEAEIQDNLPDLLSSSKAK